MNKNVLLIDDNRAALSLFSSFLEKNGYVCDCCPTYDTARSFFPNKLLPLVVCDTEQNDYGSCTIVKDIKQQHRQAKVIMMSAFDFNPETFYLLGALDCFNKLQGKHELLNRVKQAEKNKRTSRRLNAHFPVLLNDHFAMALDVSCDGIMCETKTQFPEGAWVEASIMNNNDSLIIKGQVLRSVRAKDRYKMAIYFEKNIGAFLEKNIKSFVLA
jgi:DNA-binding response OmpR family regulator